MLGRTANNLFQYALGRVLATKHGVPLVMDGSWFEANAWAAVSCLRRLDLPVRIVRRVPLAARALRKLTHRHYWEYGSYPVWRETPGDHSFDPRFLEAPASCVLYGYFQCPRYFAGMEDILREELDLGRLPWSDSTRRMEERLLSSNSVAVHVRRDDYVRNPDLNVCGPSYYARAMDLLRSRHSGLRFHVFSDDPEWCREHLAASDVEVCALPEGRNDPLHDLHLMSRARHHIIANSSYSWWAAWLGAKPGQEVLMPSVWFRSGIRAPIEEKRCAGWEIVEVD
jgi:hypothetical protein